MASNAPDATAASLSTCRSVMVGFGEIVQNAIWLSHFRFGIRTIRFSLDNLKNCRRPHEQRSHTIAGPQ